MISYKSVITFFKSKNNNCDNCELYDKCHSEYMTDFNNLSICDIIINQE